jgi:hypothetical protein
MGRVKEQKFLFTLKSTFAEEQFNRLTRYFADVHVVVIGGGYAGSRIAHDLDAYCKVTLIDKRDGLFINVGAPRAVVEPGFQNTLWVDYKSVLKNGHVSAVCAAGINYQTLCRKSCCSLSKEK